MIKNFFRVILYFKIRVPLKYPIAMKAKFYPFVCVIGCLSLLFNFQKSIAQCACGPGIPLDSVVQENTYDSIVAINTNIVFNKFDSNIGTLTCLKLGSTVTSILNFDLYNKDSAKSSPTDYIGNPTNYRFRTFRESTFDGPGSFYQDTVSPQVVYGPFSLQPPNTIDPTDSSDEIHIGPDTVFNNAYRETYHSNVVSYLGAGTVTFNYLNTSTTTMTLGSSNYDFFVRAYSHLTARLVYYWCPTQVLASGIKNFTTKLKDNYIQVQWLAQNQSINTVYELQVSTDGKNFTTVYIQPSQIADGTSSNYQYQYGIGQNNSSALYFRIKQTDISGKATYTKVNTVSLNEMGNGGTVSIYPNPATNNLSLQFDKAMTGDYSIDIINLTGQKVYNRSVRINNTNSVQLNLSNPPIPGMYYLRATDKNSGAVYTNKLFIKQ